MPTNKTSHIEKIAEALKKVSPDSPLLTTMRKRFQQVKSGQLDPTSPEKGKTPTHAWQRPGKAHDYISFLKETGKEDSKESWAEFKRQIGVE